MIIAKTTLPELAICGFTETERWGITRNPWDTERSPGGSSGGSAAAVAAGLVGAASASDGAGSIRIPAAFCGLFGLKPQRGRLPLVPPDHWWDLSVHGCLTRSVLDTAALSRRDRQRPRRAGGAADARPSLRRRGARSRRASCGSRSPTSPRATAAAADRQRRVAWPGSAETEELLRSLGHQVQREDPKFGLAGNNLVPRYLRGHHDDIAKVPHPERLEARTRGFGRLGAAYRPGFVRRARRLAERDAERINRDLRSLRRADHADRRRAADRGRPLAGRGRAAHAARA